MAEGVPSGAAYPGTPVYAYPVLAEKRTLGKSRIPFGPAVGSRDVDCASLRCSEAERWLREGAQASVNESFSDADVADVPDVARGVSKVAEVLAARR